MINETLKSSISALAPAFRTRRKLRYSAALHPTWDLKLWTRLSSADHLLTSGQWASFYSPFSAAASLTEVLLTKNFTAKSQELTTNCRLKCIIHYQEQQLTFYRVSSTQMRTRDLLRNKSWIIPGFTTFHYHRISRFQALSRLEHNLLNHLTGLKWTEMKRKM